MGVSITSLDREIGNVDDIETFGPKKGVQRPRLMPQPPNFQAAFNFSVAEEGFQLFVH